MNTPIHIQNDEHNEAQRRADGMPLLLLRTASSRPSLANTKPQKAVEAKQTNVIQDSTEREVIDAAPPRMRQIDATTNSARNIIPSKIECC